MMKKKKQWKERVERGDRGSNLCKKKNLRVMPAYENWG